VKPRAEPGKAAASQAKCAAAHRESLATSSFLWQNISIMEGSNFFKGKPAERPSAEVGPSPAGQRELERFGVSGLHELSGLRAALEHARGEAERRPDDERAALRAENAEKRLELFGYEHDNAGAFKFNRFGGEMKALFDGEDPELRLGEAGRLELAESAAARQMVIVNMGELDRFNKEGGHRAGDAGLEATAHAIEETVLAYLRETDAADAEYHIYRYSGNEFMVSVSGLDEAAVREVVARIEAKRPQVSGVGEGAPLAAETLNLQEVADIMNALQAELPPDKAADSVDAANRELVEIVRRLGDYRLETRKFAARAERMRAYLASHGREDAETFFRNFMAKSFIGTPLETIDGLERLATAAPEAWQDKIDGLALEAARRRFASGREHESVLGDVIRRRLDERLHGEPRFIGNDGLQDEGAPLAVIPEKTAGQAAMDRAMAHAAEVAKAPRLPELAERAALDAALEVRRRDNGTGLLGRGAYFKGLEASLRDGRESSVAFVDMGFLKYFDKEGGTQVADGALKVAAEVMEKALAASGVSGEVYRVSGDEFTIRVDGDRAALQRVMEAVKDERDAAGRIPATERSAALYEPTKLSFNYGLCDRQLLGDVYADLKAAGYYGEDDDGLTEAEELNRRAALMTVIADRGIEEQKAVDRFVFIVEQLRDERHRQNPARREQVKALIRYSEKALLTEGRPGEAAERSEQAQPSPAERLVHELAALPLAGPDLERHVRELVAEKIEAKRQREAGKAELMDQLIDLRVQISQLRGRLADLERDAAAERSQIAVLRERLAKTDAERTALIEARRQLT
jgi:GGDEF domain-containing protein